MKSQTPEAKIELRPQPGPQERFLSSKADIAIYGGSAGSGKTFALLLESLYHVSNPGFRGLILRRTVPQLKAPGGLWDTSADVYTPLKATAFQNTLEWVFPSGAIVKFSGMETEGDRFAWQGSQLALIMFDELTHFSESQFFYMLSRNRSMCGIKPYVRATCNPDPDSFVRNLLEWWIDPATGLAIPERSGILRWFLRYGDELAWADTREELIERFGADSLPRSFTFVPARLHDNRLLMEKDPAYLSNLRALPLVDRARLLDGNWNIRAAAGLFFQRQWFEIVDTVPDNILMRCRYWDRAATPKTGGNNPDATVGLLLAKTREGLYFIEDVQKLFASPWQVERAMRRCAETDPKGTIIAYMQDPGSAGVAEAQATARALDGFNVRFAVASGDKETRAKPVSSQAEAGNVKVVRGLWNNDFFRVLENFPGGGKDDDVDALSGAHSVLATARRVFLA
ncbi:MAG: phage terminase large subunit [Verrucomicrobiia bacterium]